MSVFSFKVDDALFSIPGKISLKLGISTTSNKSLLDQIVYLVGDSGDEVEGHTLTTNEINVLSTSQEKYHKFPDGEVTFYLPKGLCQDEAGNEVTLHIAAHDKAKKIELAQSSFVVYPRPSNTLDDGTSEEIYWQSGELLLVKHLKEESITVLVGKLKYEASLRQQESPSPVPSTPSPVPSPTVIPTPSPEPSPEIIPEPHPEPQPEPEPEPEPKQPTPPPPPPPVVKFEGPKQLGSGRASGMVAHSDHEEIVVIVHAATGLPALQNNTVPRPYVLGKIETTSEEQGKGSAATEKDKGKWQTTRPTVDPTTSPQWEDVLYCKVASTDEKSTEADVLQLKIVDKPSKIEIATFELPVPLLQPFHQYHLELVQATPTSPNPIHLYVSVYRKLSFLPSNGDFSFFGLELRLLSLDQQYSSPAGPLVAVAKIVPDYQNYKDAFREHTNLLSVQPTSVDCPVPHPTSFLSSIRGKHQGFAQLWLADLSKNGQSTSTWNHSFLFCDRRELASMFVSTAALVVELYDLNSTFDGTTWYPHSPVGYAVVLLDNKVYNALTSDRGKTGVRVPHVPLQACKLPSQSKKTPSLSLALRLLTSQTPGQLPSVSNLDILPTLEGFQSPDPPPDELPPVIQTWEGLNPEPAMTPPTTPPPEPLYEVFVLPSRKLPPLKDDELPPSDALQALLDSDPQERLVQPGDKSTPPTKGLIPTRLPPPPDKTETKPPANRGGPSDQTLLNLLDSQQRELDGYRQAMKRMGEEVIQLQGALSNLEAENSRLRQQANMYEDTTRAMMTDAQLDSMTKAEMLEKYVTLKRSLSKQVSETANYREKLLHAQNELIKHNDRETKYLEQQEALVSQSKLLQERQDKVKKLELACREQEKALEKMDKALRAKTAKQNVHFKEDGKEVTVLSAENARLKAELETLKATTPTRGGSANEAEKLKMQFMLERAEGRVASLERELLDKAKEWGKEKAGIAFRSADHPRQQALPPLPYYDRGKPQQDISDLYADRSYGNRRPRLGYGTSTRLSPLF